MALPSFLVLEMRSAFRACAQQHRACSRRSIVTTAFRYAADQPKVKSKSKPKPTTSTANQNWPYNGAIVSQSVNKPPAPPLPPKSSMEIVPKQREQTSLDTDRRVPVPLRVIPGADLGKNLHMTPRERLHIEALTRQLPRQQQKEKKIYRERLQIYHVGSFKENFLAVLNVSCLTCLCVVGFVFLPAHIKAGTALWIVSLIGLGGLVPGIFTNYATRPMVTRIFLELPTKARDTNTAAMDYAKNLPRDASIDIRFLKPWGIEGSIKTELSRLEPVVGNLLRPLSFQLQKKYQDPAWWQPSSFYVGQKTAIGEKSKNTIPGIWDNMYRKLMRIPEGTDIAKWKR